MFSASRSLVLLLALISAGCTTKVYHSSKTQSEMLADIQRCKSEASRMFWNESMSAAGYAYECLEQKGYQVSKTNLQAEPKPLVQQYEPTVPPARGPCRVPCRRE